MVNLHQFVNFLWLDLAQEGVHFPGVLKADTEKRTVPPWMVPAVWWA